LAEDVDVRQEVHLDPSLTFTLAGLAASAGNIEREPPGFITALPRFWQHRIQIANLGKAPGVSCGIGSRRAPDGRLIDANDFVDILRARNRFVCSCLLARAI